MVTLPAIYRNVATVEEQLEESAVDNKITVTSEVVPYCDNGVDLVARKMQWVWHY